MKSSEIFVVQEIKLQYNSPWFNIYMTGLQSVQVTLEGHHREIT